MKKRQMYMRMVTASLLRRRSRMVIALLAIAIGATILSGLVTIYVDVPRQLSQQFRSYGANMIITSSGEGFTQEDVDKAVSLIPKDQLVGVTPYRYDTVRINDRPVMAAAMSMEEAQKTSPFWSVEGRWPSAEKEIMVGESVAETYNLKEGKRVTCTYAPEADKTDKKKESKQEEEDIVPDNFIDFTVTGILSTGGKEEDYVYMGLKDMENLTGSPTVFDICELSVSAESKQLSSYADSITGKSDMMSARLVKRVTESETKVFSKLQSLVLLVTIIVLALTMISVATTMTAVVAERRMEIGLRKALGASNQSIVAEFMGEGLVLGAVGGAVGAVFGFLFAQAVSVNVFNSSITFMPWLLPLTIIASVIVTGIACLLPIRSATDIDPALVLKGE